MLRHPAKPSILKSIYPDLLICFIIDGIDFAIEFFNFGLPMDPCNGSTMNGTVLSAVLGLSAIGDFILSWGCPVLIVMLVLVPNIILFGRIAELVWEHGRGRCRR